MLEERGGGEQSSEVVVQKAGREKLEIKNPIPRNAAIWVTISTNNMQNYKMMSTKRCGRTNHILGSLAKKSSLFSS